MAGGNVLVVVVVVVVVVAFWCYFGAVDLAKAGL